MRRLRTEILVRSEPWWGNKIQLLFSILERAGPQQRLMIAEPLKLREATREDEGVLMEPTVTIAREEAQFLMDQLWECGLRPSAGHGSAGQLAAVQEHLRDMRTIAFKGCGIDLLKPTD